MTRILLTLTVLAATLAFPGLAAAAPAGSTGDSVFISFGTLRAWADTGQADAITISAGGVAHPGRLLVRDAATPAAVPGAGCLSAGADGTSCDANGVWSLNVLTADGDDAISADVALPGWLDGGTGNDDVRGGGAADTVLGGDGNDVLDGRGGDDTVSGGIGDDQITSADGVAESVDCGAGSDTALVDPVDTTSGCELVSTPASEPIAPTSPTLDPVDPAVADPKPKADPTPDGDERPADTASPKRGEPKTAPETKTPGDGDEPLVPLPLPLPVSVGVADEVARVSADGRAALDLACAPTEVDGCRGQVFLDPAPAATAKRAKRGKKAKDKAKAVMSRRGRYGKAPFVIAAGKRARLQVTLTPAARRALGLKRTVRARAARRGRRVRAKVTVVPSGSRAASRSVVELRS